MSDIKWVKCKDGPPADDVWVLTVMRAKDSPKRPLVLRKAKLVGIRWILDGGSKKNCPHVWDVLAWRSLDDLLAAANDEINKTCEKPTVSVTPCNACPCLSEIRDADSLSAVRCTLGYDVGTFSLSQEFVHASRNCGLQCVSHEKGFFAKPTSILCDA